MARKSKLLSPVGCGSGAILETLLEEARADCVAWRQSLDEQLAEIRRDRESNGIEHRAFTQNIQILLAEISRLWQRLDS